ncbi:MAG: NAD(P)-dependent oxidoreductase [Magnetococcales bacterium]|nr:NAD(P)-dependent oxidoreductase [Magnetococcales bacterium]
MRKAAITGGQGWIGRRVTALLASEPSGEVKLLPLAGDVRRSESFTPLLARFGPGDALIHLAGALPRHFAEDPQAAEAVNREGARHAAEACGRVGAALILASTANVYPPHLVGKIDETALIAPRSPYGQSKRQAEEIALEAGERLGMPVRILRLFNPYGPGQGEEMLLGYLAACLRRGVAAELRTPMAARDFLHLDDVARAFLAAALTDLPGREVFNIGSGRAIRVRQAAEWLAQAAGAPLTLKQTADAPEQGGEGDWSCADIRRARDLLGWNPLIPFEQGVASCLEPSSGV